MTKSIDSVLVNPVTQMVALVARKGLSNLKPGQVFGRPIASAVKLLKEGRADVLDKSDLPKLPKGKEYRSEKVNIEAGTHGEVKALSTKDMGDGKSLAEAKASIIGLENDIAAKDAEIKKLTDDVAAKDAEIEKLTAPKT